MSQINRYVIQLSSGPRSNNQHSASIILYNDAVGNLGSISFFDTGIPLPPWRRTPDNRLITSMPLSQLPVVVDLLRNEKPVFYEQVDSGGGTSTITLSTRLESVGEGE